LEYVNIFQGDFIMVANLFGPILKQVLGAGASQQPATIQRTEVEQKPITALEQVNAAVITPPGQLRADVTSMSQAVTPQVMSAQEISLPNKLQETNSSAIKLEISQKTVDEWKPILSKAVKTLMEIIPFIAAEIKTILPKSKAGEIFSNIIQNNGGTEAAKQWLETHIQNNPLLAQANTQATANPA
jgi:hypothetical protein